MEATPVMTLATMSGIRIIFNNPMKTVWPKNSRQYVTLGTSEALGSANRICPATPPAISPARMATVNFQVCVATTLWCSFTT